MGRSYLLSGQNSKQTFGSSRQDSFHMLLNQGPTDSCIVTTVKSNRLILISYSDLKPAGGLCQLQSPHLTYQASSS